MMSKSRGSAGLRFVLAGWLAMIPISAANADPPQTVTAKMLDLLAQQYRDEGLPLPPPHAPLMIVFAGSWSSDASNQSTPLFLAGYRLKTGGSKTRPDTFLVGTEIYEPEIDADPPVPAPRVADVDKPLPADLDTDWLGGPSFPVNYWLALAIQCHLRGCDGIAKQIFDRGLARDQWSAGPTEVTTGNGGLDPNANRSTAEPQAGAGLGNSLAATAWSHWMNMVVHPGTDRNMILGRMEKLLADHPALDGPSQRSFIKSLQLTVQPSRGKPGSIEALIDGLTECAVNGGSGRTDNPNDANYARLQLLGFDAMPALLAHMDDQRLTRSVTVGFNNFSTLPRSVGEVVSDLIEGLAGPDLGDDWLPRQLGYPADTATVRQWWNKARAAGEEAYVCSHVIPAKKGEGQAINQICLRIVAARYPRNLGEIYTRVLKERADLDSSEIVQAIGDSKDLGRDEQLALLREGAENPHLMQREDALAELLELDPKDAQARLIKELNRLPRDAREAYWLCPEAHITYLVLKTGSPAVWDAFKQAAIRARVGLRMEMMNPLDYSLTGNSQRKERLAFLAAFLDDDTVRVNKDGGIGKYDGPSAAFTVPKISVQEFAAMKIGSIAGVPGNPDAGWTDAQWTAYRATIRAALKREAVPGP